MLKFLSGRVKIFATIGAVAAGFVSCKSSYPSPKIEDSVQQLFEKELKVKAQTQQIGKTLYVAFLLPHIMDKDLKMSDDTLSKLEGALLSISRIALSTDAKIDFVVVQLGDDFSGMRVTIVRYMEDLKALFYWRIPRSDFEERMILETVRYGIVSREKKGQLAEKPPSSVEETLWGQPWQSITLENFWAHLVISRLNIYVRSNMFFKLLAGDLESVDGHYDAPTQTLNLKLVASRAPEGVTQHLLSDFVRDTILDEVNGIEKKYRAPKSPTANVVWAKQLIIRDSQNEVLGTFDREVWLKRSEKPPKN